LVLRLADQRPDIRVIIRPHPSEKAESWRQIAEPLASVSVVENTDPNPWILASRLVLTTGCTTGLEAALLDRPVVSMIVQREDNLIPPMFLANEINPVVRSISQAIECVGEFWDGSNDIVIRGRELRNQLLSEHIEFDSERLASELIANIVEEASANRPRENSKIEISNEHEAHLRKNVKKIHWEKGAFSETDIRMRFDKIFSVLGKHKPITINSVGWSVFELTPQ